MKKFLLFPLLICLPVFAAEALIADPALSDSQFLQMLSQLVGGPKGAGTLAVVYLAVQGLALGFKWRLGQLVGFWRLTIVSGLTWVGGVLGLVATTGMSFAAAFTNAANLALLAVFVDQLKKQWQKKEEDKKQVVSEAR